MKYSFFSDLHIKNIDDEACQIFVNFCNSQNVKDSSHIYLLGDMFDMLIGEHEEYITKYNVFFNEIVKLLDLGKKVTYLEGNHDFHVKKTITKFIEKNSKNSNNFQYLIDGEYLLIGGDKYYFCHGDDVDYFNHSFKRWKKIYTSLPFKILVNFLFPYRLIEYLGHSASNDSKKRGRKKFDYNAAREKYRKGAAALIRELDIKGVIAGHTHIQEIHHFDNNVYINCGFPKKDMSYIHFNGSEFIKVSLRDS